MGEGMRARGHRGLREQAAGAALWMSGSRVANQALDQAFTLVLVRLLAPGDFGLIAMAGVFTALLNVVSDMGIARAIVQRQEVDEEYASTAFWGNLTMGVILSGLAFVLSGPIARVYGEPKVQPIFAALALRFLIAGTGATQVAMLWRGLKARALVIVNLVGITAGGATGISLALAGAGVWALVGQALVTVFGRSMLLWLLTSWRPVARFSWVKFKDLWGFGSRLLGARIFRYVVVQMDNLLIGRTMGHTALGFYAFAYGMFLSPLIDLSHIIGQVSFSMFSRLQEDLPKLRHAFLTISRYMTLFALPSLVGFFLIAPDLITLAFGAKWLPAVPVLRILLLASLLQMHTSLWSMLFGAMGRADWVFTWSVAAACVYVPAFVIGLRWGIAGVAAGYTVSTLVLMPFQLALVVRLTGLRLADYIRSLQPLVLASLVMAGIVWLVQARANSLGATSWARLGLAIPVGVVSYAVVVLAVQRDLVADLWRTLLGLRRRPRPELAKEMGATP
ncbi:MAG TPA: MOP flippase family protein [Dehalococcoidia bacterium]|nr:MOP flippase family protein [Dehalococcoidia bacterium]